MFDIIIRNGIYPDFNKNELVQKDIGIKDGKIAEIGSIAENAVLELEGEGRIVSPGFIDIHMHEENFLREGERYCISELMLKMGVTTCLGGNCGVQYQDIDIFKDVIKRLGGAPVNYLMSAGYNEYRKKLGIGIYESATRRQQEELLDIINRELGSGAVGVSFGIEYDPGMNTEEIMNLLDGLKRKDIFVSAHYRTDSAEGIDSIREMIEIAEKSELKFQISHLSSCSAMGQMSEALQIINQAVLKNPKLNYDTYPYSAFSTEIGSAVFDDGCFEKWGKGYESILITDGEYKGRYCDKELFEKIRRENPDMLVVAFVMREDEIGQAIANSWGMIASDGIVSNGSGHPRAAGTFPRVLGRYVREEKLISMVDALRKMTLEPANRLGLTKKGRIEVGCDGDITIFNPNLIEDGADFYDLNKPVKGIEYVILAGKKALVGNEIVNGRLGRFIGAECL